MKNKPFNDETYIPLTEEQEAGVIEDMMELLKLLNWSICYRIDPDNSNKILGFVVGGDNFVNDVLSKIDGENVIDINETFNGNRDELN